MERVIYKKDPLVEVIIQIRFPKILALNTTDPVAFQEAIKQEYPNYQLTIENQQELSLAVDKGNTIPSIIQKQQTRNHNFISADGTYKINLTSSFISISTLNYTRWEEMLSRFEIPLAQFVRIYQPPFYERVGLRYIDAFSRDKLSLTDTPWNELIAPFWLGAYSVAAETRVINSGIDAEYYLDDGESRAKIHAGIGNINNNLEKVFVFDSDFINIGTISPERYSAILEYLHTNAKVFIRSAITDKLHEAMDPEPVK